MPSVPALGPMCSGDKSVLDHVLTHATKGLDFYPAFDTCWHVGDVVEAPEEVKIIRHSGGTTSGYSIYATGKSGLRYYVTHLNSRRAAVGTVVPEGGRLGTVGDPRDFPGARVAHAHVGINVELLLGVGKQLRHNTNYTTAGQPTVGTQLRTLLGEEDEMTKERVLELRKLAFSFDAGGRVAGTAPRLPNDAESAIFYNVLLGIDAGRRDAKAATDKLQQIKALINT